MNRLGDTSAFVIPAGQLLLTRRGKTRMYTVGIVFEFYTVPFKLGWIEFSGCTTSLVQGIGGPSLCDLTASELEYADYVGLLD